MATFQKINNNGLLLPDLQDGKFSGGNPKDLAIDTARQWQDHLSELDLRNGDTTIPDFGGGGWSGGGNNNGNNGGNPFDGTDTEIHTDGGGGEKTLTLEDYAEQYRKYLEQQAELLKAQENKKMLLYAAIAIGIISIIK